MVALTESVADKKQADVKIEYLSRALVDPSPWNPRKTFDEGKLAELRASTREKGIILPLIVRPKKRETVEQPNGKKLERDLIVPRFEIVAGERRYRASGEGLLPDGKTKVSALATLPCIVRELSDDDAREISLMENLQRVDLTDMEEAESFHAMLQLKDEAGKPRYTVAALASKIGRAHDRISARLKLVNLPTVAREALIEGKISALHGELIGRVPGAEARAKLTKEVLEPKFQGTPLSTTRLRELIAEDYTRSLAKVPFDPEDAFLVAAVMDADGNRKSGGKCSTCPFRTGNSTDEKFTGPAANVCTNLDCFKAKEDAEWDQWAAKHTDEAKHKTALGRAANGKIFQSWGGPSDLAYSSPYVKLADKPEESLLTDKVKPKDILPWRTLIAGRDAKIVVARNKNGVAVELVDRVQAVTAAKLNAHKIFDDAASARAASRQPAKLSPEEQKKEDAKREREERIKDAVFARAVDSLVLAIQKKQDLFAATFVENAIDDNKYDKEAIAGILKRRGLDPKTDLTDLACDMTPGEQLALGIELKMTSDGYYSLTSRGFTGQLITAYKIDLKSIEAQIKKLVADKEAADAKVAAEAEKGAAAARIEELKLKAAELAKKRKAGKFNDEDVMTLLELAGPKGMTAIELAYELPSTQLAALQWFTKGTTKKIKGLVLGGELNDSRHVYTPVVVAPKLAKKAGKK